MTDRERTGSTGPPKRDAPGGGSPSAGNGRSVNNLNDAIDTALPARLQARTAGDARVWIVDPEFASWAATWSDKERREHIASGNAEARRRGFTPKTTGDHSAAALLRGLCASLLRRGVRVHLAVDLTQAWNEARVWDPLPTDEVRALCNQAAADELRRRRRGDLHAA